MPTTDIACRFGGDEFAVILPESTRADAEQLAQRIVGSISGKPVAKAGAVGASTGVAELGPDDRSIDLFERADAALYRAKDTTTHHRAAG